MALNYYRQQQIASRGSATLYPEGNIDLHRCISGDEMTMKSYPVNIIVSVPA